MTYQFSPSHANQSDFRPVKSTSFLASIKIDNVFTPEQILELKPKSNLDKLAQLKSPGYVILLDLFNAGKESYSRRPTNLRLREHTNRFIPSEIRKKYITDPEEERKYAIQTCLNKLSFKNTEKIIQDLCEIKTASKNEFKLPFDQIIAELLLDRATANEDSPEKNSHLHNFANLAIIMSSRDDEFKTACKTLTLKKYTELITTKIPLNSIECLIVWISYLVMGRVIKRREYFKCLELAMKNQPKDNSVDIIRASFYTCGKFLDEQNWTESATFYYYIQSHPPSSGYLEFLLSDLLKIRSANWNTQHYIKQPDPEPKADTSTPAKNFDYLKEKLLDEYTNWHSDPSYGTPHAASNAQLVDLIRASLNNYVSNIQKLQPELLDYCQFLSILIEKGDYNTTHIPEFLKSSFDEVKMPNELVPDFYTLLGSFYYYKLIDFKSIVDLGVLKQPEFIDAIGKVALIDQNEIRESLSQQTVGVPVNFSPMRRSASSPLYKNPAYDIDEDIITALVAITDWAENKKDDSTYDKAVNFSRIIFAALEEAEDGSTPPDIFDKVRQNLIASSKGLQKVLLSNIWKKALSTSLMSPEFIAEAETYFNNLKF